MTEYEFHVGGPDESSPYMVLFSPENNLPFGGGVSVGELSRHNAYVFKSMSSMSLSLSDNNRAASNLPSSSSSYVCGDHQMAFL